MKKRSFFLASLGCAKNTVDSNAMAQLLQRDGYLAVDDPLQADLILVNTCGFIEPAREESYAVLRELADQKQEDQLLIAAGCLTQRYGKEVLDRVPGIDGLLGTRRWMDILDVVERLRGGNSPQPLYHLPEASVVGETPARILGGVQQGASAYLKIADGCRRPCAFCAIPGIKGSMVSRPLDRILQDARALEASGVKEINLIAQDTTDYGSDLGLKDGLAELLEKLTAEAQDVNWLRILYAYPGYITDRLIEVMASSGQILPYIDIPLQHGDPEILKKMRRPANIEWVFETVGKLRRAMPDLALRTTFIVGYPGETDQAFQKLVDFVKEIRFDRVGAFTFSFEPGTASEVYGDPIPQQVKQERQEALMLAQQEISLEKNQALIGKTLDILVEGRGEVEGSGELVSLGRSYRDAPEIDGMVIVEGSLPEGEIVPVRVTGAMVYDLTAVPAENQDQ